MNRSLKGTVLWACLAGLMGSTLFFIKHEVKDLEGRLASVHHDIQRNQEDIHVLKAEWSFLNDPTRLHDLAERHLGMKQMGPTQIATLNNLNVSHATAVVQAPAAVVVAMAKPPAVVAAIKPPAAIAAAKSAPRTVIAMAQPAPVQHHRFVGGTGLAMASPMGGEAR